MISFLSKVFSTWLDALEIVIYAFVLIAVPVAVIFFFMLTVSVIIFVVTWTTYFFQDIKDKINKKRRKKWS